MAYQRANLILLIVMKFGFWQESTQIGFVKITWEKSENKFRFKTLHGKTNLVLCQFDSIDFIMKNFTQEKALPVKLKNSHSYWKRLQELKNDSEL